MPPIGPVADVIVRAVEALHEAPSVGAINSCTQHLREAVCSTQLGRIGAWDWRCSTSGGGRTEPTPDRVAGCSVSGR